VFQDEVVRRMFFSGRVNLAMPQNSLVYASHSFLTTGPLNSTFLLNSSFHPS
jgi:hypothetical protein